MGAFLFLGDVFIFHQSKRQRKLRLGILGQIMLHIDM